jgi:hypothetical protein
LCEISSDDHQIVIAFRRQLAYFAFSLCRIRVIGMKQSPRSMHVSSERCIIHLMYATSQDDRHFANTSRQDDRHNCKKSEHPRSHNCISQMSLCFLVLVEWQANTCCEWLPLPVRRSEHKKDAATIVITEQLFTYREV